MTNQIIRNIALYAGKKLFLNVSTAMLQSAEDFMMGRYYFDLAIRRICIAINAENHTLGQKL